MGLLVALLLRVRALVTLVLDLIAKFIPVFAPVIQHIQRFRERLYDSIGLEDELDGEADGEERTQKPPRVCIIGAGPSGLACLKVMTEEGIPAIAFEQSSDIGGIWNYTESESHSSAYQNLVTNTSRDMMSFCDYPMPPSYPTFLHRSQVFEYLQDYAKHFKLYKSIRLESQIRNVKYNHEENIFTVEYVLPSRKENGCNGHMDGEILKDSNDFAGKQGPGSSQGVRFASEGICREDFDVVVVANGHYWKPKSTNFEGQNTFPGVQIHSHAYKAPDPFAGKTVIVVGMGASGSELAADVSSVADRVFLSSRSIATVLPHFVGPCPSDQFVRNRLMPKLPSQFANWIRYKALEWTVGGYRELGLPHPTALPHTATRGISSGCLQQLKRGAIQLKPNISHFDASRVFFDDGSCVEADAVIYCTGYTVQFPFLDESCGVRVTEGARVEDLHYQLFHCLNPNLCFLALNWAVIPFPLAELQSRWIAGVVSGRLKLPSKEKMLSSYRKQRAVQVQKGLPHRFAHKTDDMQYCGELARIIGCFPRMFRPTQPELMSALLFGPVLPFQYRLDGPGLWAGAAEAILRPWRKRGPLSVGLLVSYARRRLLHAIASAIGLQTFRPSAPRPPAPLSRHGAYARFR